MALSISQDEHIFLLKVTQLEHDDESNNNQEKFPYIIWSVSVIRLSSSIELVVKKQVNRRSNFKFRSEFKIYITNEKRYRLIVCSLTKS